jgi:hypothetical protein
MSRSLALNSVTGISLTPGLCAAVWFLAPAGDQALAITRRKRSPETAQFNQLPS